MNEITAHAKVLWDYLKMGQELVPMDAIFALGSDSVNVAKYAAELWRDGYGKYLIVSGGNKSRSSSGLTEGEIYANIAHEMGVPLDRIIVEHEASNTGENILFTKELLKRQGYDFQSFVLVQKPYMERRVYATFSKLWPEAKCIVTSPKIGFEKYIRDTASRDRLVHHLVGTLWRIREYPKLGFQTYENIPADVEDSYNVLIKLGYGQF